MFILPVLDGLAQPSVPQDAPKPGLAAFSPPFWPRGGFAVPGVPPPGAPFSPQNRWLGFGPIFNWAKGPSPKSFGAPAVPPKGAKKPPLSTPPLSPPPPPLPSPPPPPPQTLGAKANQDPPTLGEALFRFWSRGAKSQRGKEAQKGRREKKKKKKKKGGKEEKK